MLLTHLITCLQSEMFSRYPQAKKDFPGIDTTKEQFSRDEMAVMLKWAFEAGLATEAWDQPQK